MVLRNCGVIMGLLAQGQSRPDHSPHAESAKVQSAHGTLDRRTRQPVHAGAPLPVRNIAKLTLSYPPVTTFSPEKSQFPPHWPRTLLRLEGNNRRGLRCS